MTLKQKKKINKKNKSLYLKFSYSKKKKKKIQQQNKKSQKFCFNRST